MKYIILPLIFLNIMSAQAFEPTSNAPGYKVVFECSVNALEEKDTEGYYTQKFNSFKVVQYDYYHSTVIGTTDKGEEFFLSENVDKEIRSYEPMRGFTKMNEILQGDAYHLLLSNDSDQPEAELLLNKNDADAYKGVIQVFWDYTQKYSVTCI